MSQAVWGWCYAIGRALLVGLGSLLATHGWNKIRAYDQWRNAMLGVVREVELNDRMIAAATSVRKWWPSRSEGENFSCESYHSSHATSAVTSGLLSAKSPKDHEVLKVLEAYERAISCFNAALRIVGRTNPALFIRPDLVDTTDPEAWPPDTQNALADSFIALLQAHGTARDLLKRQYPWATRQYS